MTLVFQEIQDQLKYIEDLENDNIKKQLKHLVFNLKKQKLARNDVLMLNNGNCGNIFQTALSTKGMVVPTNKVLKSPEIYTAISGLYKLEKSLPLPNSYVSSLYNLNSC